MRLRLAATLAATAAALSIACSSDRALGPNVPPPTFARGGAGAPLIYITEIMSDPTKVADAAGEWFEVFNAGATPVDMQGWRILSGVTATPETHIIASSVVVPAGGFAVFGNNANSATNGGVTEAYSYATSITLNNSNTDWLALKDAGNALVDSVAYSARSGATIVAPTFTPSAGISRAVTDINLDYTLLGGGNWANTPVGTTYGLGDRGTPGSGPYAPVVAGGPPASVTITPAPAQVVLGSTRGFSATARDVNGLISATTFTWFSSDGQIATIDNAGVATGVALGQVTITVTTANGVSTSTTLDVVPQSVGSIIVAINSPRQAPVGYVKPAFPTVRDANNQTISPTPALTWSSSDNSIATVDTLGYITAVAVGNVTITATAANNVSGSNTFTVIPATAPTNAHYLNHVEFGVPTDNNPSDDILITRPQYMLSYNAARGGPNWVSWDVNASVFGAAPRCDCFSPDPQLPSNVYHVVDLDYRNGGYDRGHMVMSEERTDTDQENAATFILTNVLPQAAENNQGPWLGFETYINDLARLQGKEIYVVSGGEYASNPGTLKSAGLVQIPDYTWKIAVVMPAGQGLGNVTSYTDLQVLAVRMPNLTTAGGPASAVGIRNQPWQNFLTTVNQIESATGYDFLAALPDPIELLVEANDQPPVADAGGGYAGVEGGSIAFNGSASSDPDNDPLSYAWDFGDGQTGAGAAPSHSYTDNGSYTVTLTVSDPAGATATATTTAAVVNAPPVIGAFTVSGAPAAIGATLNAAVSFTDPGSADTHTTSIAWGDGATSVVPGEGAVSAGHAYAAAGLYTVSVTVTDNDGGVASQSTSNVVVYSTTAYIQGTGYYSPGLVQNLDVNVRYTGATLGNRLRFARNGKQFVFEGITFNWLVVTADKAVMRGSGHVIGGTTTYQFALVVRDPNHRTNRADGVRLKVWDAATGNVIYDDQPGQPDYADVVSPLLDGSLMIRRP